MNQMRFSSDTIFDVVTCNPFTIRGRSSLGRLGIDKLVNDDFFFENDMYVDSIYSSPATKTINPFQEDFRDFSSRFEALRRYSDSHDKLVAFEERFFDKESDLLYIVGAGGTGKSVYAHYLLRKCTKRMGRNFDKKLLNLEVQHRKITREQQKFQAPLKSAPWLFCVQLLRVVCDTIRDAAKKKETALLVAKCFDCVFNTEESSGFLDKKHHLVMEAFKEITKKGDSSPLRQDIIKKLYDLIDEDDVGESIVQLLHILTIFCYCLNNTSPDHSNGNESMTYIVVDNIEHYIKVPDNKSTTIFDPDIRIITDAFDAAKGELRDYFAECKCDFQKHFKFVIIMRHSTMKLLYRTLQNSRDIDFCAIDISGWFDFSQICEKKMESVLPLIKEHYPDEVERFLSLFNCITRDNDSKSDGNSFIEMAQEMFNNSNRRLTASMATITFQLSDILYASEEKHISDGDYFAFWEDTNAVECRYLLRRTLIEQLLRSVASKENWNNLLLSSESIIEMSLFQRVLLFLARRTNRYHNTSVDCYISLESLICGLFVAPEKKLEDTELDLDCHFRPLAKILFSMNQPVYAETAWSPLCVLLFHQDIHDALDPVREIAKKLSDIWKDIKCGKYALDELSGALHANIDTGIRITRAGFFFLHFISDYSLYLARFCMHDIPLLYNANHEQSINIITKIYIEAEKAINLLNTFDDGFFDEKLSNKSLDVDQHSYLGGYLLLYNDKYEESIQQLFIITICF